MADEYHLEIIKQGADEWNRWRRDNPDVQPDLRGSSLRGVQLSRAELSGSDLREADLHGAHLSGSDLREADLRGAHLRGAYLRGAHLSSARLTGADLSEADLSGADFGGADLGGANLRKADLIWAHLRADLSGADLSYAKIGWTTFADNDLSKVKGLETVVHYTPSTVGVDTLFKSQGNIPPVFLRGCGLPEDFITYVPSLTGRAIEFYSCFISYSHADQSFARRLHDTLQGQGIRCWLDEHQLLPGHDIYAEVDRGVRLWDKVLLCCSESSLTSWWVDNEINSAFDKEQRLMKERKEKTLALIPLDLDGYLFSGEWQNGKAGQVRSRLAANFTGWQRSQKKFEAAFGRLVRALRTDGGREPAPTSKL
jgi:hypothetical protein